MTQLTPPLSHRRALLSLARMEEKEFSDLVVVLEEDFTEESAKALSLPTQKIIDTLETLLVLRDRYQYDLEKFALNILTGAQDAENPVFTDAEVEVASARLMRMLEEEDENDTKAQDVIGDLDRAFCRCRILTDARPVFGTDVASAPKEIAILHTIKLGYHQNGRHEDIYVTSDADDLKKLRAAIDRALTKEETMTQLFHDKNVDVLDLGGE